MAACYFMGARSGKAKKSGDWFGCFSVLHKNGFGQWTIDPFWFADEKAYTAALNDAVMYASIYLLTNPEGKVVQCEFLADPPILQIAD